jgi:glycosyltransferase involved in cell wall biosynthesis
MQGYYQALKKMLDTPSFRKAMRKAAQKKIQQFEWSEVVNKYEKMYEEVAHQRKR